ncbi:YbjN domain-containing protein [Cryomorpha ignava]|uniref:YbjN domain-containing protein n=1 Tax=Cryomorpha ignava TaxID=101383 RepID=A0A7K3WQB4_9FLAO|nr:YbjN domain-containing protein [Cryomorpha ignava]NEN23678.1 YbjN domain-containing protein [Cryomorpha ignava]
MKDDFNKVKNYILDLGHSITKEDEADGLLVIDDEGLGIKNLVIGLADSILIMEQYILELKHAPKETYIELLKKNRDIIHGAFVLDESGQKLIFRDTLQMENLDQNELEGSINSLTLLLSEFSEQLIGYSKH